MAMRRVDLILLKLILDLFTFWFISQNKLIKLCQTHRLLDLLLRRRLRRTSSRTRFESKM